MQSAYISLLLLVCIVCASKAVAQTIPGSVDPGRVEPFNKSIQQPPPPTIVIDKNIVSDSNAPQQAKDISFMLKRINIQGAKAFTKDELRTIYGQYERTTITLDTLWKIAQDITKLYAKKGYFLSKAYVPVQEISNGRVIINVSETSISDVVFEQEQKQNFVIKSLVEELKKKKPVSSEDLESFMLRINAMPGKEFKAVLDSSEEGMVILLLELKDSETRGSMSIDNYGSRFAGPFQTTASYSDSFLPLQNTSVSILSSLPTDELNYFAAQHQVLFYPDWVIDVSSSYAKSRPGHTLEPNRIRSNSVSLGVGLRWQPVRQRHKNLAFSFGIQGKNVNVDILGNNALTRDRIRTLNVGFDYDFLDKLRGYNYFNVNGYRAIESFGGSNGADANLSRAEIDANFTKLEFDYTRVQPIFKYVSVIGRLSMQYSSSSLFSSEEFGYGGQSFGRAYDSSEITGDSGVAASVEFRYNGLNRKGKFFYVPYSFYDIGKVWNNGTPGLQQFGSSFGFGMIIQHSSNLQCNLGIAFPLIRDIATPIYWQEKSPRILFQMSYPFDVGGLIPSK